MAFQPQGGIQPFWLFRNFPAMNALWRQLNYREAWRLCKSVRYRPPDFYFTRCGRLRCEARASLFRAPHDDTMYPFVIDPMQVTINHNHVQQNGIPTRATFYNQALQHGDVSLCVEPQNVPAMVMHGARHPIGRVLVCQHCKHRRLQQWQWRKRQIAIGVCSTCRTWALANLAAGQNDCTCEPTGHCVNAVNNNEKREGHMCQRHMVHYWNIIQANATQELHDRGHLTRTRAPKRRGHGWTRRKPRGRAAVRTPDERRAATRVLPAQVGPLIPRCYCGNVLSWRDHRILEPPFPAAPTVLEARVRNCLGCGKFVRYW